MKQRVNGENEIEMDGWMTLNVKLRRRNNREINWNDDKKR